MTSSMRYLHTAAVPLSAVLMGSGCEVFDDANSQRTCQEYCSKKFDCGNRQPTENETNTCVGSCRNSIEDNCGNDHQAGANEKIGQCTDKSCAEFGACMVFDAAPECFGFVK